MGFNPILLLTRLKLPFSSLPALDRGTYVTVWARMPARGRLPMCARSGRFDTPGRVSKPARSGAQHQRGTRSGVPPICRLRDVGGTPKRVPPYACFAPISVTQVRHVGAWKLTLAAGIGIVAMGGLGTVRSWSVLLRKRPHLGMNLVDFPLRSAITRRYSRSNFSYGSLVICLKP